MVMATCREFIKERKTAYAARFPFLTDSQVSAKLRRIWNASQGPGSVNELLPPTVGTTIQSRRKRATVHGSRASSLARPSPQAIKENTDISHSKDIPACSRTSGAGVRCDPPQTTVISNRQKSPLLASSLNVISNSDPHHSISETLSPEVPSVVQNTSSHSKTTDSKTLSKPTKQKSSPVKAVRTRPVPPHLWSLPRRTRSKTAAIMRGEAPPSEQTTPSSQSSQEEELTEQSSVEESPEVAPQLIVSDSPGEEHRERVKSSSPEESFMECGSKSSEPVSPVENPPLASHSDSNTLCNLFSPLKEQGPSSGNKITRTLMGPVRETEAKGYCLFEDATDIFM